MAMSKSEDVCFNEKHIRLLDCTLRDGAHLNGGNFGEAAIKYIIKKLVDANIDIIEVGFLHNEPCSLDVAKYYSMEDVKRILPENRGNSKFAVMADFIDLHGLEPYDGSVEYVRLSFKRHRLTWALDTAKELIEKGYKVYINPVNNNVYTDEEYLQVIGKVNELHPYGFSIVDTFGVMRVNDLLERYLLVEKNLASDITIGVHLHENMGLALSLAQEFAGAASPTRNITIDGSLLGMGRIPGNLCIEQIMDHLNNRWGTNYNLAPAYDAIDNYVAEYKREYQWGYSIPFALSGQFNLHRTYAEYLMGKWKLKTADIQAILGQVEKNKAELFDEEYIEKLYRSYMNTDFKERSEEDFLRKTLLSKNVIVVAPGASIKQCIDKINNHDEDSVVICVNFAPDFLNVDYTFYTNIKRYEMEYNADRNKRKELIVTSNLTRSTDSFDYVLSYGELTQYTDDFSEDSVLMFLHYLKMIGKNSVKVAGFDGYKQNVENYYKPHFEHTQNNEYKNKSVLYLLRKYFMDMEVEFISDSFYKNYKEQEEK
ncbi:MAG: aldolase catalytic domain-containing protein [Clostridiales bacterium]|nr:aldolase catalytic domain-containing protein [Clostridiales bacterium]